MSQSQDDKRRDEVLKRMLHTPPKKQAELKREMAEAKKEKRTARSLNERNQ